MLHCFPESNKFFQWNLSISIHIYLIEELFGWEFAESTFPVVYSFFFVDLFWTINVKDMEYFVDTFPAFWAQLLELLVRLQIVNLLNGLPYFPFILFLKLTK